ncbi:MAG TPA: phosphatase PAP2 family protein [candidate division Zixibacteria bacterium]|nr:phosphatase PAP2 family protein [candidate division Zixibacteria bacterium]
MNVPEKVFLRSIYFLLFLSLWNCFIPQLSEAQDKKSSNVLDFLGEDFYQDGKELFTSPFHLSKNARWKAAGFLAVGVTVFLVDEDLQKFFQDNRNRSSDKLADFVRPYGDKLPNFLLCGVYLKGLVFKDQKAKDTAYLGFKSILFTQAIVISLKYITGRERPSGNKGVYFFKMLDFSPGTNSLSFPSGHASTAFAFSSVIAHQYPEWWVKILVYSAAGSVAWSRLNDNVHFTSDVLVGSAIGWYVGSTLTKFHQNKKTTSLLDFQIDRNLAQLQLKFKF